jgi:hypothetical protein
VNRQRLLAGRHQELTDCAVRMAHGQENLMQVGPLFPREAWMFRLQGLRDSTNASVHNGVAGSCVQPCAEVNIGAEAGNAITYSELHHILGFATPPGSEESFQNCHRRGV